MPHLDPNQPSAKTMSGVRNRNNISEMLLKRQIDQFERQRSMTILNLDHDRLDLKDFLRQLRVCNSDELPEARIWLGDRRRKSHKELQTVRNISTAPAGGAAGTNPYDRDVRTAPDKIEDRMSRDVDVSKSGAFRTKNDSVCSSAKLYQIFSRRAELVETGPTWKVEEPVGADSGQGTTTRESKGSGVTFKGKGTDDKAIDAVRAENTPDGTQTKSADILVVNHDGKENATDTGQRKKKQDGDFMKDLLVTNAKKKYKKKKSRPLEDRLSDFYTKMNDWKEREEFDAKAPTSKEARRRYKALTMGIKAALADSSDEDENNQHTL